MANQFKGFDLFSDQPEPLRSRNRAVVLANMFQDNSKEARITPKGASLLLGYFQEIPEEERATVEANFVEQMRERGFLQTQ